MLDNLTLLTDFYQLTMMQGYFFNGKLNDKATFDLFYRKNPFGNGYVVMAGLQQVVEYITTINVTDEDADYLRSLGLKEAFVQWFKNFKFRGNVYAIPEGTIVFPGEPLIMVDGTLMESQFIETTSLCLINHQSLIATKASRIVEASKHIRCLEFGLRRAQGPDGGFYGARASYIGGFSSTSNVKAGKAFGIPVSGTMAHSWVMSFDSELSSFEAYAYTFPENAILLVDTYDTLKSGIPNAITVFTKLMKDISSVGDAFRKGKYGIRIDSGDLAVLTIEARKMLDAAGFSDAIISVSNDLDENTIESLILQDACIDVAGVGTKNITAYDCPALGGVYKLSSINGKPKMKISENIEKVTNPGRKQVYRITNNDGMIIADLITLASEVIDPTQPLHLMDEKDPWKNMILKPGTFVATPLLQPVIINGQSVMQQRTTAEIRQYCIESKKTLWPAYLRNKNPHIMKVNVSNELYDLKRQLLFAAKSQAPA